VTPEGFFFVADPHVKFQSFSNRAVTTVARLSGSQLGTQMSLAAGGKVLLTTQREDLGASLFYIDNFK